MKATEKRPKALNALDDRHLCKVNVSGCYTTKQNFTNTTHYTLHPLGWYTEQQEPRAHETMHTITSSHCITTAAFFDGPCLLITYDRNRGEQHFFSQNVSSYCGIIIHNITCVLSALFNVLCFINIKYYKSFLQ